MLDRLKAWARALKRDVLLLWLAARDPRVAWSAKLVAGVVAAYALSPIDLIPDFIPVLGYLDDLLIVPAGIWLALRMIPAETLVALRPAAAALAERPVSRAGAAAVIAVWLALCAAAAVAIARP